MPTVTNKRQMYAMLERGDFGNTIPMWTNVEQWENLAPGYRLWGVRTMTPGGPCRLNCPVEEVAATFREFEKAGHRAQISMMVDGIATVTAWLEAWRSPTGLVVEGIEYPRIADGWAWRNSMQDPQRRRSWLRSSASAVLAKHLNPNSRADLDVLLDQYPDHVVEMAALDRCIGTVPHRNAIVWEVRSY